MFKKYNEQKSKKAFLEKLKKDDTGCWNWTAGLNKEGYGRASYMGKHDQRAHRIAWMIFRGEIPEGLYVCHKCDNKKCVKPSHLFLGTHDDNMKDGVSKKRFLSGEKRKLANNPRKGEAHHNSKLSAKQALKIIELKKEGKSYTEINSLIGINRGTACDVICGRTWSHVTNINPPS